MRCTSGSEAEADLLCSLCGSADIGEMSSQGGFPLKKCSKCGLQFLHPQPDTEELRSIYSDYYRSWDIDASGDEVSRMKMRTFRGYLEAVKQYVPSGHLLDVGCATGELLSVASEMGYYVHGIEISPKGVARCRIKFGEERITSKPLVRGDFPDESFDLVTMCDVLEHLETPVEFLDTVEKLLKPGGILLIATPDTYSWSCRLMKSSWPHYKKEHLYYFNRSNMLRLLPPGLVIKRLSVARKCLTLRYCLSILDADNSSVLLTRLSGLLRFLPGFLQVMPVRVAFGEMLVLVRKERV
ncbi:MAG: class I SAM-dependent methyltransferase [Desulfuromonadaceae bacterium]|nr:class I SAM-dependent methyltransferase [Desulfuromonadaceae bacterium]MDD2856447.1 class I SAM-dependent methyltransferase [Desulfuromonadaceae bacterium]